MKKFNQNERLDQAVEELRLCYEKQSPSPKERIHAYLHEGQVKEHPIYLVTHSIAAKYLGVNTKYFFTDLGLHAAGQVELTKLLGHDYVYSAVDIFDFEAEAIGARLDFSESWSNPSLVDLPLSNRKDFSHLKVPNPHKQGRLPALIGMKSYLYNNIGDLFEIEATGSSPFSLACHLRGYQNFIMDMMKDPDYASELLDFCVEVCRVNLTAQLELGLSCVHIADAWAAFPMVTERIYDRFIFPSIRNLFAQLKSSHQAWTGLYGLSKIKDWQGHLHRVIDCGATELCVYQNDLLDIDLGELTDLVCKRRVSLKIGIYGTCLTPYDQFMVEEMLKTWIKQLDRCSNLAMHVSNLPWDASLQDVSHLVRTIRNINANLIKTKENKND